ncbi:MAG: metallophosphoesterase [Methylococcales bacterium]|nr:MAG: metallophosphoesterase [Methylococcales bacterium]
MNYDIIGDIHGQYDKLIGLLNHLGYTETNGIWSHNTHKAIFVGDLIDNSHVETGISHISTVRLVKAMVEAGSALCILGNHEFNAIAWLTPNPEKKTTFLREHNDNNSRQHGNFLAEVGENSAQHHEIIEWFKTLPLWLELPEGIRVIHAAWIEEYQTVLKPYLTVNNCLTDELVIKASRKDSAEYVALEALCKGLEIELPEGYGFNDKHGAIRTGIRIRWWKNLTKTTYKEVALVPEDARDSIPDLPIEQRNLKAKGYTGMPVFFGHYWFSGQPKPEAANIACVDYSAGKSGDSPLVAYRWEGESVLIEAGFRFAV